MVIGQEVESRSWYSAEDRLVAMQKYIVTDTGDSIANESYRVSAVWEEYRYDPLGRRILVRTSGRCRIDDATCGGTVTRWIWVGDQLLWELRAPRSPGSIGFEGTDGSGAFGRVSYTHGGGIDRPLVITKADTSIVPHRNWRGQFAVGTYADGPNVGRVSDCAEFPAQNCVPIQWPGERETVYHELFPDPNIQGWFGSLVDDMRDATGQMYRRNRYYDPQTGQFTQPDPIGLTGGLNAYGFAEGDPVTYSDPYGLASDTVTFEGPEAQRLWGELKRIAQEGANSDDFATSFFGTMLLSMMQTMEASAVEYHFVARDVSDPYEEYWGSGSGSCNRRRTRCEFSVDTDPRIWGRYGGALTVTAHEASGVYYESIDPKFVHARDALIGENFARFLLGCPPRPTHQGLPPQCAR